MIATTAKESGLFADIMRMGLVAKIFGSDKNGAPGEPGTPRHADLLTDGALDTLGSVIRSMGDESFPLDSDIDPTEFPAKCAQFARHVENGAAVPAFDIKRSPDGAREWWQLRRFFADRRRAEKTFVAEMLHDYRHFVEDLVEGLRQIGDRDRNTETSVTESLHTMEQAIDAGAIPDIKAALVQTIMQVSETFARQKEDYETQIDEITERMSNLRQDLVAAHEEMKRDPLTDAYNRGAFDTAITQSLNIHFILNQPVTLVLIDVDKFKHVNDDFGHAAGDEVLRKVSECLERSFIRKGDLVARYGGDEFAVILNDTSAENSTKLINRFMQHVSEIRIPSAPAGNKVTCSAGFTEFHSGDSVESLIDRVDKALYQAKADGRNLAKYIPPFANE